MQESQMKYDQDISEVLLVIKDYGISMISSNGYVITWNPGGKEIYGYDTEEVINKHISFLYTADQQVKGLPQQHLETACQLGMCEYEEWKEKKDGSRFYANISYTAFFNPDQSLKGYSVITRDRTVAKKLELENNILHERLEDLVEQRTKELATANAELEAFSYSVSHDLRTPLRAISGYSEMLKDNYVNELDLEAQRIIATVIDNARMMGMLIDDLLAFSRMGRLVAVSDSVNMTGIVKSCLNDLSPVEQKNITLQPLPNCTGDPTMLKQVWVNLISNACKYSSKNKAPQIYIGSTDDEKYHIYYIKDNGIGFEMKYYPKLFGVFQRLHRQDEFEGTGLGLALARRIISKHSGEIWGEATPGGGATFYFKLPKIIYEPNRDSPGGG